MFILSNFMCSAIQYSGFGPRPEEGLITVLVLIKMLAWVGTFVAIVAIVVFLNGDTPLPALALAGKRVVICGASTGIGEQTALVYAAAGAKV